MSRSTLLKWGVILLGIIIILGLLAKFLIQFLHLPFWMGGAFAACVGGLGSALAIQFYKRLKL